MLIADASNLCKRMAVTTTAMADATNVPSGRIPGRKARNRRRHRKMEQHRQQMALVTQWINQYGQAGSGRLERHELARLLEHLHPDAGPPNAAALDKIISQATEVRAHSFYLRGDPEASIRHEMVMRVVSGYSMYLLASVAIERRTGLQGVIALRELPALMREATEGTALDAREIDFVLDIAQGSVVGMLDIESTLDREHVLIALQGMAMRFASEAQRQFQEDQARLDRINQMQRPASTPSFTTPSTPSGGDEHEGLYLEEYNEEGDLIEGGGGGAGGGGGEFDLETHLHGWRNRRALRIQAYARRVVAVGYFRKARAAAIIIQSAARSRTARALMMKRRAAAALITRMGKGRLPKKLAQRRRDAATLITKIAKGKVTRKLMVGLAQGVAKTVSNAMASRKKPVARARTFGDFTPRASPARVARSNTVPVGLADFKDKANSSRSRMCIIS